MTVSPALLEQLLRLDERERVEIAHAPLDSVDANDELGEAERAKLHAAIEPVEDRANAAKLLLDSLDEDLEEPEAEALRAAELSRRARAVADGSAELIDAGEVRRRVATRLRDARDA